MVQLAPRVPWVTVTRGMSSSVVLRTISFLHAPPCDPFSTPAASAQHLRFFIVFSLHFLLACSSSYSFLSLWSCEEMRKRSFSPVQGDVCNSVYSTCKPGWGVTTHRLAVLFMSYSQNLDPGLQQTSSVLILGILTLLERQSCIADVRESLHIPTVRCQIFIAGQWLSQQELNRLLMSTLFLAIPWAKVHRDQFKGPVQDHSFLPHTFLDSCFYRKMWFMLPSSVTVRAFILVSLPELHKHRLVLNTKAFLRDWWGPWLGGFYPSSHLKNLTHQLRCSVYYQ